MAHAYGNQQNALPMTTTTNQLFLRSRHPTPLHPYKNCAVRTGFRAAVDASRGNSERLRAPQVQLGAAVDATGAALGGSRRRTEASRRSKTPPRRSKTPSRRFQDASKSGQGPKQTRNDTFFNVFCSGPNVLIRVPALEACVSKKRAVADLSQEGRTYLSIKSTRICMLWY